MCQTIVIGGRVVKNEFQGKVEYNLLYKTDMGMEEFMLKFHQDNIIDMKVLATLSDGSVHTFNVCELLKAVITSFEVNGEEMVFDDVENKEKITKINSVIKIAI
jgi:hypothetical protein